MLLQNAFGLQISHRRIMDVRAGDEHVLAVGASGLGEHVAPTVEGGVANLAPVHGDEHDGLLAAGEDDALGEERVGDGFGQPRAAHHAVAHRHGHVGGEGTESEVAGGLCVDRERSRRRESAG